MVLSLITLATTLPLVVTSTLQLDDLTHNKADQAKAETKTEKGHFGIRVSTRMNAHRKEEMQDMILVVRNGCVYLDNKNAKSYHPVTAYHLPFPGQDYDGLVTTINNQNMLNWVFVDVRTSQVRYGDKAEAVKHLTGPTSQGTTKGGEMRLTMFGWEGYVAVKDAIGDWALDFDRDDDGLQRRLGGKNDDIVEVEVLGLPLYRM